MIGGIEQFPSIDAPNEDEMPLTDVQIKNAKSGEKAQRLFDGGGLYLELSPAGGKLWRLKYRIDSKECQSAPNTFHLSAPVLSIFCACWAPLGPAVGTILFLSQAPISTGPS